MLPDKTTKIASFGFLILLIASVLLLCSGLFYIPTASTIWLQQLLSTRPTIFPSGSLNASSSDASFVARMLRASTFDIDDFGALQSMCLDKTWTPGLVMTCDNCFGGLGNVRNSALNCVRYAIEAGAELVLPEIRLRRATDLNDFKTQDKTSMDYLFDKDHFVASIRRGCPQLKLHMTLQAVPYNYDDFPIVGLLPADLETDPPMTGLARPDLWRSKFFEWLLVNANRNSSSISPITPQVVALQRSYLQFPVYYDGSAFVKRFGRLLRFRNDLYVLAAKALQSLTIIHNLHIDPSQPTTQNAFFGAHLRTESDTHYYWPAGTFKYTTYEEQSRVYFDRARQANTTVLYVASGDLKEIEQLTSDAAALGLKVTDKTQLLEGADLVELQTLRWDQQAIIDFLMLEHSSYFGGVAHSSFAWNVALRRHQYSKVDNYLEGVEVLEDDYSTIYGDKAGDREVPKYAACMWP